MLCKGKSQWPKMQPLQKLIFNLLVLNKLTEPLVVDKTANKQNILYPIFAFNKGFYLCNRCLFFMAIFLPG